MNFIEQASKSKDRAILYARKILSEPYCVVDTETTRLAKDGGQVCEMGLFGEGINFLSFVKATEPISPEANKANLILDIYCKDAPDILGVLDKIPRDRSIVFYNAPFDLLAIENSVIAKGGEFSRWDLKKYYDMMVIFANFYGEWSDKYGDYKWQKLTNACKHMKIDLCLQAHNALNDAIMTDALIKAIAEERLSDEQISILVRGWKIEKPIQMEKN